MAEREGRIPFQIGPALLDEPSWDRPVMKEEIFGSDFPIISIDSVLEAERIIKRGEKPLALYLFTSRKLVEEYILDNVSFGGGCINDTVIHLATNYLPFGGVGNSGMGAYHGKYTFETFTREKSVQKKRCGWICRSGISRILKQRRSG